MTTLPAPRTGPRRAVALLAGLALIGVAAHGTAAAQPAADQMPVSADHYGTVVERYCVSCHNERLRTANLNLEQVDPANVADGAEVWEKVLQKLQAREMPPVGRPRPDAATGGRPDVLRQAARCPAAEPCGAVDRSPGRGWTRCGDSIPGTLGSALSPRRRHLAYMAIWTAAFLPINALEGVGDVREAGLPLWQRACERGRLEACRALAATYAPECVAGSPRACNELGILAAAGLAPSPLAAPVAFARACSLGLPAGCANAEELAAGGRNWRRPPLRTAPPREIAPDSPR